MELSCLNFCAPSLSPSNSFSTRFGFLNRQVKALTGGRRRRRRCRGVRATEEGSSDSRGVDHRVTVGIDAATTTTATAIDHRSLGGGGDGGDFGCWEKLEAVVRLGYGVGIYGAMALAGNFICSMSGVDSIGGFHLSLEAIVDGLVYAAPPTMALLFILDDEVVKCSPHARAIRDVEDEELRSFFYGMSPWQFILIVIASSVGEELFYRAAVQGSLADMFMSSSEFVKDGRGLASLTGMLPLFVPFARAFAAVVTAALTGSLYYILTDLKDPTYVVAPVFESPLGPEDLKKHFAAWYERRQMKKIYSPLLEGLLALYLGYEWIRTGNILAPMITHGVYSAAMLGRGLWKIHHHQQKMSNRIKEIQDAQNSNKL